MEKTFIGRMVMRIAMLSKEYPPHVYGGAGVHVLHLSRELARVARGRHDLEVLCFGEQSRRLRHRTIRGVPPAFPVPFRDRAQQTLLDTLSRNFSMAAALCAADLVHCHTWYTHVAGCVLKQQRGIPLVLTAHSLEPRRPWKEQQLGSGYGVSGWIERTAYENADGVIAVSASMSEDVHAVYGVAREKIRVIHNGVDTARYKPKPDPSVLRGYGIDPEIPFVLFVGRITPQKGLKHLLRAVSLLCPGCQVVLCAADPDTEEMAAEVGRMVAQARAAGHRVLWLSSPVPEREIVSLYTHAAVFVCPSVYEPFGITNLEAMACETPVVASSVGGIREVVLDGETGWLIPLESRGREDPEPKDEARFAAELASAVNRLLASPEAARAMGRRARQVVEQRFSWRSVARRTLRFYEELTGKP
jgi:glycogen synthase